VVFQKQKDDFATKDRAQMYSRNDPSAPLPVEVLEEDKKQQIAKKPYQFLLVSRLREYLALDFNIQAPFPIDPERIYDDFGALPTAPCVTRTFLQFMCVLGMKCMLDQGAVMTDSLPPKYNFLHHRGTQ